MRDVQTSASTRLTASSAADCPGRLPPTVRVWNRTFAQGCFSILRKNHAFEDWKGLSPRGCTDTETFTMLWDPERATGDGVRLSRRSEIERRL